MIYKYPKYDKVYIYDGGNENLDRKFEVGKEYIISSIYSRREGRLLSSDYDIMKSYDRDGDVDIYVRKDNKDGEVVNGLMSLDRDFRDYFREKEINTRIDTRITEDEFNALLKAKEVIEKLLGI